MSINQKKIEDETYTRRNYSIRMHHSDRHVLHIHKDFPNEVITSNFKAIDKHITFNNDCKPFGWIKHHIFIPINMICFR